MPCRGKRLSGLLNDKQTTQKLITFNLGDNSYAVHIRDFGAPHTSLAANTNRLS